MCKTINATKILIILVLSFGLLVGGCNLATDTNEQPTALTTNAPNTDNGQTTTLTETEEQGLKFSQLKQLHASVCPDFMGCTFDYRTADGRCCYECDGRGSTCESPRDVIGVDVTVQR